MEGDEWALFGGACDGGGVRSLIVDVLIEVSRRPLSIRRGERVEGRGLNGLNCLQGLGMVRGRCRVIGCLEERGEGREDYDLVDSRIKESSLS